MKFNKIPENLISLAAEGAAVFPIASMLNKELKKKLRSISCEDIYEIGKDNVEAEFDIILNESKGVRSVGATLQGTWNKDENFLLFFDKSDAKYMNLCEPYFHDYVVYVKKDGYPINAIFFSNINEAGPCFHEEYIKLCKELNGKNTNEKYNIILVKQDADTAEEKNVVLKAEYIDGKMQYVL